MYSIFLGILFLLLAGSMFDVRKQSKKPDFKPFEEPYKNKWITYPSYIPTGIVWLSLILFAYGGYTLYHKSDDTSADMDFHNIKTQAELDAYVVQNAHDKCDAWHRDNNLVNETNKDQAVTFDDDWIDNFSLTVIPDIVQTNDLPNSYIDEARTVFQQTLKDCGYVYHLYH